jgi:hypothetical protein
VFPKPWVIQLHVVEELLALLIIALENTVDILHQRDLPDLLLAGLYLDFLIMDVLLEPPQVIIPGVEVIRTSQPLVLCQLLLYVVFCLLHVD